MDVAQRVLLQSQLTGQLEASAEVQKATVPERLILRRCAAVCCKYARSPCIGSKCASSGSCTRERSSSLHILKRWPGSPMKACGARGRGASPEINHSGLPDFARDWPRTCRFNMGRALSLTRKDTALMLTAGSWLSSVRGLVPTDAVGGDARAHTLRQRWTQVSSPAPGGPIPPG